MNRPSVVFCSSSDVVRQRRRDPLHRMPEQVQQHEALHFESDVGIDHDPQSVEDARPRRLQVAVLDRKTVLHDPDEMRTHRSTRSALGSSPTTRAPTSS